MSPSRVATGTTTHNWVLLCDVEIILNCGCQCVSFTWTDNIAANNPKNRESVLWHHISSKKKKKVKPWATKSQRCDFFFMPISSSELAEKEYFQCTVLSLPWVDTRGIKHSWAPAGLITAKLSFFSGLPKNPLSFEFSNVALRYVLHLKTFSAAPSEKKKFYYKSLIVPFH